MKTCPACLHPNTEDVRVCRVCGYDEESHFGKGETLPFEYKVQGFNEGDLIDDRYRVIRELGYGGMGVVYLVQDTGLRDREVALKMIHPNIMTHPEARKRFEDEVITCLKIRHPNIVQVYDFKRWGELCFFTME